MELLLEATSAGWTGPFDAAADVEADDRVGTLAAALWSAASGVGVAHPTLPSPIGLRLIRTGEVLAPDVPIGRSGLATGDVVELVSGATPGSARLAPLGAVALVDLRSGPDAGRSIGLGPGRHVLGRLEGSQLRIDDPALSRQHAALDVHPDGTVVLEPNPAAVNGTFVGGFEVRGPTQVRPGQEVFVGATVLALADPGRPDTRPRDRLGQIPFNPTPYRRAVPKPVALERVQSPPSPPTPSPGALVAALAPVVGGVLLALITRRPEYLLLTILGPIGGLYQRRSSKKIGRRTYAQQRDRFVARVERRRVELAGAVAAERVVRLEAAPDVASLAREAQLLQLRLWERRADSADALELRLGLGRLRSKVTTEVDRTAADEELTDWALTALADVDIEGAPITIDLATLGIAGLHGARADVEATLAALVIQAATLHSPEDLAVAAALPVDSVAGSERPGGPRTTGAEDLSWIKWLPHARTTTSPLEGAHVVVGHPATNLWLVRLLGVAADRLERSRGDVSFPHRPRLLVLVHERADPDRALVSQLLDVAPAVGIQVVWAGLDEHQLPRQCAAVAACDAPGTASRVWFTDPDREPRSFDPERLHQATAAAIARSLAPLRDASTASLTTAIPRKVALFEALELVDPSPSELLGRWAEGGGYELAAALGVAADGILRLDLVEQGPHALIAGTSGSGKSELLQTLVCALAAAHPPTRCTFLFIDYKGGASSAEFRDLPHTVGYVTNLDGRMSLRALTSLRAELGRRMRILEGRAKDLEELLAVAPTEAPPSLVIIIDEFATLVKEIPDFVAGIVDIAQRGRSLGIHLVLATQRPTGAVNDNILANTNLRLSLRVLDPADSVSVINSPEAANVPVPLRGRGFVRTGPRELTAFQCAWSGAPFTTTSRVLTAEPWLLPGQALAGLQRAAPPAGPPTKDDVPTQLEVLVKVAAEAAQVLRLPPPRQPWVEPLPDLVPLAGLLDRVGRRRLAADPGRLLVLGLLDDPANQAQEPALVDLEQTGGLVVYGGGGSGKTTALRTIAAGLASQGGPEGVLLYALDFANRALDQLRPLPHCAGVAMGDDLEAVTRLLTVLATEVERRRRVLADAHAESLSALREQAGAMVLPRIVLLIDGYGAFHAAFDQGQLFEWIARAHKLVAEGRQVGVHFVITADRRTAVPPALLAAIAARFVLRMADADDMAVLGVPVKVARAAELETGRGFLDGTVEVQLACASDDHRGAAQAGAIAALGSKLATTARARPLPALPDTLRAAPSAMGRLEPVFGVADLTLEPVTADLRRGHLIVVGPQGSGRSGALLSVALGLHCHPMGAEGARPWLVGLGRPGSPLATLGIWDDAGFTGPERAEAAERLATMLAEVDGRRVEAVVVIDQAEDTEDSPVSGILERVARSEAARIVVACDIGSLGRTFGGGWLQEAKRSRSTLVLQPEDRNQVEALGGVRPSLRPGQTFPPGRGVYVHGGGPVLMQVQLPAG